MLELRRLSKHHRSGDGEPIRAVDGISTVIHPGEFVALYGPSGSGKTTLVELIAGLQRPDRGSVLFDGQDIFALSPGEQDDLRLRQIGLIGGPDSLIPGASALENAALKLLLLRGRREAKAAAREALIELGLDGRLGHRTDELSMGERQRVLIARVLVAEPRLVLADEPTGSLDTRRTREVLQLLRAQCSERGVAVLLVTHDPQAAEFADRVHELRDGRLVQYVPEAISVSASTEASHPWPR